VEEKILNKDEVLFEKINIAKKLDLAFRDSTHFAFWAGHSG
jgi:hypothetical protein